MNINLKKILLFASFAFLAVQFANLSAQEKLTVSYSSVDAPERQLVHRPRKRLLSKIRHGRRVHLHSRVFDRTSPFWSQVKSNSATAPAAVIASAAVSGATIGRGRLLHEYIALRTHRPGIDQNQRAT